GGGKQRRGIRRESAHLQVAPCADLQDAVAVLLRGGAECSKGIDGDWPRSHEAREKAVTGLHGLCQTRAVAADVKSGQAEPSACFFVKAMSFRRGRHSLSRRAPWSRSAIACAASGFSS